MHRIAILALAPLGLMACATTPVAPEDGTATGGGVAMEADCDQEAGQQFVGRMADAELGQALLAATGARQLRWVPPNTAVTMDFRPDRLSVEYDDEMIVTRVSCG